MLAEPKVQTVSRMPTVIRTADGKTISPTVIEAADDKTTKRNRNQAWQAPTLQLSSRQAGMEAKANRNQFLLQQQHEMLKSANISATK